MIALKSLADNLNEYPHGLMMESAGSTWDQS